MSENQIFGSQIAKTKTEEYVFNSTSVQGDV